MERTLINNLKVGTNVRIEGWVQEIRDLNKIKFIILRDRTGDMQTIALKSKTDTKTFEEISILTKESVIILEGEVKENKESHWGIEVLIKTMEIVCLSETPLPIDNSDKSNTNQDKRIDFRFLDARNIKNNSVFQVRSKIVRILTDTFDDLGFTNINTPKITTIGLESGAESFSVKYFDKNAALSQSPQMYKQMMVSAGFERVYEIGVVFRAEKSHTKRHLTEFTGVDFEMGFIKDENDVMDTVEIIFKKLVTRLITENKELLSRFSADIKVPKKIPRIAMKEIKEMLAKKGKKLSADDDLDSEAEKIIGEYIKEKYDEDFVFVTNYPFEVRPFYHMKPKNDPLGTRSFDLLYRGVEIATGAQREHRHEVLIAQAKEKGIETKGMTKYTEIFRFGTPPHGGVGFGLDRITSRLLNIENVRDAVLLPRDPERLTP